MEEKVKGEKIRLEQKKGIVEEKERKDSGREEE
jgi:hypothetical protein